MGRSKKSPTTDGDVIKSSSVPDNKVNETVLRRLGFGKNICMECNARVPADNDSCRKCGCSQLREKKHDYRD